MSNPLLESTSLPAFSRIKPKHVESAIDQLLAENRQTLAVLLKQEVLDYPSLVLPLQRMNERLSRAWSPVKHMNSVINSESLREAYNACLPKLSAYYTELGQNEDLYRAFQALRDGEGFAALDTAQQRVVSNELRDFRLSGVGLPEAEKQRYKELSQQLSALSSRFQEQVLDATGAWQMHFDHDERLAGIPDSALAMAAQAAEAADKKGWLFNLEFPSYLAVMTHARDRDLREEMYRAFTTRASNQGPNAGTFDNGPVIDEMLRLKAEQAALLGFENIAQRSVETKMADSPQQVLSFLEDLARRSVPAARAEMQALKDFAKQQDGMEELQAWDVPFYSEGLRQSRYAISQEDLRPYFPAPRVIDGMFAVVGKLFGLRISEVKGVETWHPDVTFYEIRDAKGDLRGAFYLDLYARSGKRGGAWMDTCRTRQINEQGELETAVAYLTCNFGGPVGNDPALLTHDEVTTLFHEFGHGLHHMLSLIEQPAVSGIAGVEWDAVELPSQFLENFCWEREPLDLFARHYQTGETLPEDLYRRMQQARQFQAAMQMVRQLEFALFDMRLHLAARQEQSPDLMAIMSQVRSEVAVVPTADFNRYAHSFTHIFGGGYAAGYYSYKWAEVLSADAYSRFEEEGVLNGETGADFLHAVLEKGGSEPAMDLFKAFRGREPDIEPLLRHSGLLDQAA